MSNGYWNSNLNFVAQNSTFNSVSVNNITVGNIYYTGSLIQNGTSSNTSNSTANFISTNLTTTNLLSTNSSFTNLFSNFTSLGNLTSNTGTFANKVGGSQTVGTLVITTSASLIGNTNTIGNIFTTGGNVGINTTSPNFTLDILGTLRITNSLTTGTLNSTNLLSTNNTLTNLIYTNATGTSLNLIGLSATNLTITNLTTSNLISTNITTSSLNSLNIQVSGNMTIGGNLLVAGSLTTVNITSINVIDNNITAGSLNSTFATINNLNTVTATIPNVINTNITTTSILSTGPSNLNFNSNTLGNIFTTGGNVGINTTSPNSILDIQKSGSAVINLQNTGTGSSQLQLFSHFDSNNYFQTTGDVSFTAIGQNTTRNLRLTTGGNVLIGSTNTFSPVSLLTINGGNPISSITQASIAFSYAPSPGFYHFIGSRHNGTVGSNQNSLDFYLYNSTGATGSSSPNFGNVNSMSVTATGVGIFNSNPSTTLDVNGTTRITGTGTGTNGTLLLTGGDTFGHTLYIASSTVQKRTVLNNTGTIGNLFSYDYGTNVPLNLILQAPGGNVGISTTNPQFTLDVNGSGRFNNNGLVINNVNSSYTNAEAASNAFQIYSSNGINTASLYMGADSTNNICWVQSSKSASVLPFCINPRGGGNVGINTPSPSFTLDVAGTGRVSNSLTIDTNNSANFQNKTITANINYPMIFCATRGNLASFLFANADASIGYVSINDTIGSTLNVNGNIRCNYNSFAGITLQGSSLDINMSIKNTAAGGTNYLIGCGATGSNSPGNFYIYNNVSGNFAFNINNAGNIGVGTVTPAYPLHVIGSSTNTVAGGYFFSNSTSSIQPFSTSPQAISIFANLAILTQTNFLASSDLRIKNICNEEINLNLIDSINPVIYTYKDKIKNSKKNIGFIAQNVFEHCPEAVTLHKEIIPDIMKVADIIEIKDTIITIKNEWLLKKKDVIKIMVDDKDTAGELIDIIYADKDVIKFKHVKLKQNVFIYGRQVEDFHELNYDYIFALGFAGIQKSRKEIKELKQDNILLKQDIKKLTEFIKSKFSNEF